MISQKKLCRLEGIGKTFKVIKSRDLQPKLLYPAKLSFKIEEKIKSFIDKENGKKFITTKQYYKKYSKS